METQDQKRLTKGHLAPQNPLFLYKPTGRPLSLPVLVVSTTEDAQQVNRFEPKRILILASISMLLLVCLGCLMVSASAWDHTPYRLVGKKHEIQNLIIRLLGRDQASLFRVKITNELEENQDWFKVTRSNGSDPVTIEGSSGVAVSYGFHHYLKKYLKCHVSWDGDQLALPPLLEMPVVNYKLSIANWFRYNMNVCTFSYSYVWWNWTRWEREVDWMALNGFNLALAFTGTESVWYAVYLELGLTQDEIDDHFSGPAFLAWNRMGNIRGGTKLSSGWLHNQEQLQRKILRRMRDLGITPVMPAFAGHLPRAITRLFPTANITYAARWNNFSDKYCCPAMVLPTDPLFIQIGSMFIKKMTEMYGTDHVYNCDPFNEMIPNTTDLQEIRGYGKAIYSSMTAADPSALWILQGWFLENEYYYWTNDRAKAFLTAVPIGKMVVLDLQAELKPQYKRLENFFGQPFIWCMLHNFGGTLGLQGALQRVEQGIREGRTTKEMVGIGLTMEGTETNYMVYDFFTEFVVERSSGFDVVGFSAEYQRQRYGEYNEAAKSVWQILAGSVYNYTGDESIHGQYIFNNRPNLKKQTKYWYKPNDVYQAWSLILNASRELKNLNNMFQVDLIDLTRQGIQLKLDEIYMNVTTAYQRKDLETIKKESSKFLDLLDDMDNILRCNVKFMLGPWLESAKASAITSLEKKMYERDARNQITIWGPNGEIRDYANKQWSGIVKDYFKPRWVLFFKYLKQSVRSGHNFDNRKYLKNVWDIERHFASAYDLYPTEAAGNPISISQEIYLKIFGQ